MIKNIVFDVGQVLMAYDPIGYLEKLGFDKETIDIVNRAVFAHPLWEEADRGTYPTEVIWDGFRQAAPGYENEIQLVYDRIAEVIDLMPYAKEWVQELKERGYHLYILSNYAEYTYQRTCDKMEFLPYMDGTLFSYADKMGKPDREIYQCLCDRFHLIPEETVFLDDREENIEGARKLGIHGIVFKNEFQAKKELEMFLKEV